MLLSGSLWDEPQEWMQSLLHQDRVLTTELSRANGLALRQSLNAVWLGVYAMTTDSGYISVDYHFENEVEVEAQLTALEDEAL